MVTRRKRFHLVTDHNGDTVYRDRLAGALVEWLDNEDWREYVLHTENRIFRCALTVVAQDKE